MTHKATVVTSETVRSTAHNFQKKNNNDKNDLNLWWCQQKAIMSVKRKMKPVCQTTHSMHQTTV